MWQWLFQGIGIFLALEMASFVVLGFALKKTVIELAGPYFAIAVPSTIMFSVIWHLNRRAAMGAKPQKLARSWSLSVAIFFIAVTAAMYYSSATLGVMRPEDALVDLVLALLIGVPSCYFGVYKMALIRIFAITGGQGRNGSK
jgi:hypothetical protein